jgi:hypothetical protein
MGLYRTWWEAMIPAVLDAGPRNGSRHDGCKLRRIVETMIPCSNIALQFQHGAGKKAESLCQPGRSWVERVVRCLAR